MMAESWDRIFDMDWAEEGLASPRAAKSIQATIWELHIDDVKSFPKFIAR